MSYPDAQQHGDARDATIFILHLNREDCQDHLAGFEGKEVKSNSGSYIWLSEMTLSLQSNTTALSFTPYLWHNINALSR